MKRTIYKGDDFLSAEETIGSILCSMDLLEDIKDDVSGDIKTIIKDDCVIEVRRLRKVKEI